MHTLHHCQPLLASNPQWSSRNLVHLLRNPPHDLVEDTACTPHVHLEAVVAVGQEALRSSVPACGDVLRVRGLGVHAPARTKVAKFQTVVLRRESIIKSRGNDFKGANEHRDVSLTLIRMFSGFTSLWKIPQLWCLGGMESRDERNGRHPRCTLQQ